MSALEHITHKQSMGYGLLALPLAFVALPMYVNLPHFYATQFAVPLTSLGAVLLFSRLIDALVDPMLGRLSDALYLRSSLSVCWAWPWSMQWACYCHLQRSFSRPCSQTLLTMSSGWACG